MKCMRTLILFCLFALASLTPALAQTTDELIAISEAVGKAIDDHDVDAILAHFAEDAIGATNVFPPSQGHDQIGAFFQQLFTESPDWGSSEEERTFASGSVVVKEHASIGTNVVIADTPKPWVWPHIDIFDFEGDKVKRLMSYGDYASIMVQVGLAPAPEMPDFVPTIPVPDPEPTGLSPLEANADHIQRWNSHDAASVVKLYDTDMQMFVGPLGTALDRSAMTALNEMYFVGFPDANLEIVRAIDLGDGWVVTELLATATHQGPFMGIPPMGYPTELDIVWLMRHNAAGLVVEGSFYYDNLTLMTQMTTAPWPLDGIWVSAVPTPLGNLILTTTYVAQDAAKTRYGGSLDEINAMPLLADIYPGADAAPKWAGGQAELVGPNKYEATYLGYAVKTTETEMGKMTEFLGQFTIKAYFELLTPNILQGHGTGSYYLASQDADQDGFPDEGQDPVCIPWTWTGKRLTQLPGCAPAPGQ